MKKIKTDCIHYDFSCGECKALESGSCLNCSFYINRASAVSKRRASNARLRKLPIAQQAYIAEKYYGGKAPWATDYARI